MTNSRACREYAKDCIRIAQSMDAADRQGLWGDEAPVLVSRCCLGFGTSALTQSARSKLDRRLAGMGTSKQHPKRKDRLGAVFPRSFWAT
jgi:hypothetical protein